MVGFDAIDEGGVEIEIGESDSWSFYGTSCLGFSHVYSGFPKPGGMVNSRLGIQEKRTCTKGTHTEVAIRSSLTVHGLLRIKLTD